MVMVQCPGFLRGIISLILFMPPLPPPGSMPNWATCCLCLVRTRRPPATITPRPRWDSHQPPRIWDMLSMLGQNAAAAGHHHPSAAVGFASAAENLGHVVYAWSERGGRRPPSPLGRGGIRISRRESG